MPNFTVSVAAATAVVDYDLFTDEVFARTPQARMVTAFALCGSAVVGDCKVELYVGETRIGAFYNNKLAFPDNNDLLSLEGLYVPPNSQLRCIVRDAATTNPVNAMISVQDVRR